MGLEFQSFDPKEVLNLTKQFIIGYQKAAIKKRGVKPYISAYSCNFNNMELTVSNFVKQNYSPERGFNLLMTVHYPGGSPAYENTNYFDKYQVHRILHEAELMAWNNYNKYHSDSRELRSKEILTSFFIKDHIRLNDLNIRPFIRNDEEAIFEFLYEANKIMRKKGIVDIAANAIIQSGNEIFCNTEKTEIIQEYSRLLNEFVVSARADDLENRTLEMRERVGAFGGRELISGLKDESFKKAEYISEKALEFSKAKPSCNGFELTAGTYDAILDGKVAAVSIHEVGAGHSAEALSLIEEDREMASPFKGKLGKKVAIENLNIIDHAMLEIKGRKPYSWYVYDAEGVKARKTFLVKNGIFSSYLHSRLTAGTLSKEEGGGKLTGNARMEVEESNIPEPRMSSLFLMPNKKGPSLDDMLYSIRGKGIYIAGMSFGQVNVSDAQGKVGFGEIYYINKKGNKIPLRMRGHNIHITDDVVGYMGRISGIGNESTVVIDDGWCGSDSGTIPHTASGAAIKVNQIHLTPEKTKPPVKRPLTRPPKL